MIIVWVDWLFFYISIISLCHARCCDIVSAWGESKSVRMFFWYFCLLLKKHFCKVIITILKFGKELYSRSFYFILILWLTWPQILRIEINFMCVAPLTWKWIRYWRSFHRCSRFFKEYTVYSIARFYLSRVEEVCLGMIWTHHIDNKLQRLAQISTKRNLNSTERNSYAKDSPKKHDHWS